MLILSRKPGEEIRIGDEITIAVLGIKGQQIRIGIQAPKHIIVDRSEVWERKQAEKGTP